MSDLKPHCSLQVFWFQQRVLKTWNRHCQELHSRRLAPARTPWRCDSSGIFFLIMWLYCSLGVIFKLYLSRVYRPINITSHYIIQHTMCRLRHHSSVYKTSNCMSNFFIIFHNFFHTHEWHFIVYRDPTWIVAILVPSIRESVDALYRDSADVQYMQYSQLYMCIEI